MDDSGDWPTIPGFRIKSVLGEGGGGVVYLATQESLGREVAIKVLLGASADPTMRRRFRREAETLARLHHPNVVRLYEYRPDVHPPFLVMEYLRGGTLKDRLWAMGPAGRGGLTGPVVERLARELLSALGAIHAAGLVHRDVKPRNVLFRDTGEAVLADMGLVTVENPDATQLTRAGTVLGTMAYLAPELMGSAEPSPATDLFALGVTLYEALTGEHPSRAQPISHGFVPRDPTHRCLDCPESLRDLVMALLSSDPSRRPATVAQAEKILARSGAVSTGAGPRSRRTVTWGLAVFGVLVALALSQSRCHRGELRPVIDVGSRTAQIHLSGAHRGSVACLFDASGRTVLCTDGVVVADQTRYTFAGLAPGASFQMRILSAPDQGSTLVARSLVHTRPTLTLLGLTHAGLAVAVRSEPPSWIVTRPMAPPVALGADPVWIPVGPGPRRREWSYLSLSSATGSPRSSSSATLEVTIPEGLESRPNPLDLGLMGRADDLTRPLNGPPRGTRPMDWAARNDLSGIASMPTTDGRISVDSSLLEFSRSAGFLEVLAGFSPDPLIPPVVTTGDRAVRDHPDLDRPRLILLATHSWHERTARQVMFGPGFQAPKEHWIRRKGSVHSGFPVLAPLTRIRPLIQRLPSRWIEVFGQLQGLEIPFVDDDVPRTVENFTSFHQRRKLVPGLSDRSWIFLSCENAARLNTFAANVQSISPARIYLMMRALESTAVMYLSAWCLFEGEGWTAGVVANRMLFLARHLRGPRRGRIVDGRETSFRIAPGSKRHPVLELELLGGARRTVVLMANNRAARGRFRPQAPGLLWESREDPSAPYVSRPLWSGEITDLEVGPSPILFEQLIPVEARVLEKSDLEIEKAPRRAP